MAGKCMGGGVAKRQRKREKGRIEGLRERQPAENQRGMEGRAGEGVTAMGWGPRTHPRRRDI